MKKILALLVSLFFCSNIYAASVNEMIFIGDSLSDNGNLYDLFFKALPKSPPYYKGRFTNGPTWAEDVGSYFYSKDYIDYHIYALGGATAIMHNPLTDPFPSPATLTAELFAYYAKALFVDKSKVFYTVWIGANDYLYEKQSDLNSLTTNVVSSIAWTVNSLIGQGAKNFLLLNLPDLGKIPYAKSHNMSERLHVITEMHNRKLADTVKAIRAAHPNVKITYVDVYSIFNDLLSSPQKYNEKYNKHITNINQACWQGGFLLKQISPASIEDQLHKAIVSNNKQLEKNFSSKLMAQFIANSPALSETYKTIQAYANGASPCDDADGYIFWDEIHPTAVVHQMISSIVIEELSKQTNVL